MMDVLLLDDERWEKEEEDVHRTNNTRVVPLESWESHTLCHTMGMNAHIKHDRGGGLVDHFFGILLE
jgi:hypothetical protein